MGTHELVGSDKNQVAQTLETRWRQEGHMPRPHLGPHIAKGQEESCSTVVRTELITETKGMAL